MVGRVPRPLWQPGAMRYVLTGGTGFVGGALARLLRREGAEVIAVVRDPARANELAALGARLARGDVTDAGSVAAALRGADGLFHVAGWFKIGARAAGDAWRVNVDGTRNVLTAARDAGIRRVVCTSTLAVNGDTGGRTVDETYRFTGSHVSTYDETKARAHEIVEQFAAAGLPVVTVMPGGVYGPGDTSQLGALIARVARGKPVLISDGPRMCQAHVADIARGHLLAMERGRPGEAYMLPGPQTSVGGLLDLVAEITHTPRPRRLPRPVVTAAVPVVTVAGRVLALPPTLTAETLRVTRASYLGSPAKAQRELGWSARPLREGLQQTVAALLAAPP